MLKLFVCRICFVLVTMTAMCAESLVFGSDLALEKVAGCQAPQYRFHSRG